MRADTGKSVPVLKEFRVETILAPVTPEKPALPNGQAQSIQEADQAVGWAPQYKRPTRLSESTSSSSNSIHNDRLFASRNNMMKETDTIAHCGGMSFSDLLALNHGLAATPMRYNNHTSNGFLPNLVPQSPSTAFTSENQARMGLLGRSYKTVVDLQGSNQRTEIQQNAVNAVPNGDDIMMNAFTQGHGPIPVFAPATPDHCKRLQGKVAPAKTIFVADIHPNKQNGEDSQVSTIDGVLGMKRTKSATESIAIESYDPDLDLNKTSQQKPRRKKHRPKVVSEAKPKQTPKQRTPKPTDASETPRQMRTYVRRNKPKIPTSTPPESGVEALDCKIPGPAVKSCKKALNFTLEDQLREKNFHRSTNTPPLEKLPQDLYPRIEKDFMMKATREYSAYKHEFTAISSQKGDSTEAMDPRDHLACSPYYSTRANSNRGKHKSGLKRAKCSADYMFLGNAIFSCSHGLYFPKIHKKRRTEKVLKPNTAIILSFTKALESIRAARSSLNYRREAHYFPEIRKKRRTEKVLKLNTSCILSFTHALEHIRAATGLQDYQREAAKTSKYYPILLPDLNISVEANSQASGALGHEDSTQFIKWGDINELNKRFMARTCVRELASQEGFKESKTSRSRAKGGVKGTGKKNVNEVYISCMEARHKVINAKQHQRKPRKKNSAAKSATSSFSMVLYDDHHPIGNPKGPLLTLPWINANSTDVDAIIEGMKHLSINRDGRIVPYQEENTLMPYHDQDQQINALVLYQRDGVIIPFEGTSKRLERAKVDLDDETNRVWNLLLEDINNQGIDGTDEDKTKWWQEERNVFRGRVDSFIARMRLVQGDRRFSPWKGSIVDSVVGVFLTQNVSDHLSSSAYMSLAARYPPKSENNVRTDSEEEIDPSGKELEICTVELDENSDNLELSGKAVEGHICDRNSGTLNDTNVCEEKVVNFKESQGNTNLKDNAWCLSHGKPHESQLCKETSLKELDITLTVDDSTLNDVTSSHHSVIVQNSIESPSLPTSGMGLQSDNSSEAEDLTESSASFVEILKLAETPMLHATYTPINKVASCQSALLDQEEMIRYDKPSQKAFREENDSFSNVPCNCSTTYQLLPVDEYHSHSVDEESIYVNSTSLVNTTTESAIEFHLHSKASKSNLGSSSPGVDMVIQSPRLPAIEQLTTISTLTEESSSPQKNIQLPTVLNETIPTERTCELAPTLPLSDSKYSSGETHKVLKQGASKRKKLRNPKKISYDWDSLRKLAQANVGRTRQRTANTMDSLDWEAVRCADVHEIAETIRDRGMNNMLAERIKEFLDRLMKDHGSIDLEWLREVPPDQAKEYLLSIRGLGLKSVECVRLLTLHHLAFPVDTNVGRIAVRLGWVPLQPLPESLQLHLLELYPVLESIQKYLWPRLCKLDQRTLYELHYHMITFGKVFCTKRQPNCNACPLRGECRHFASAFASARLALPGPQDRSIILSDQSNLTHQNPQVTINSLPMPLLMADHTLSTKSQVRNCEPIVEIPASPEQEPEQIQTLECDMEDIFSEDPNEIPTIKLNMEEFTQTLQAYMQSNKELQEGDMSKALVALAAEAAFIPAPKLKNVSRLRTEHHVYELPDTHHLLRGLDKREPDDPCPYLLAIWSPGETANSIEQPQKRCNVQEPGHLCSDETCFYCNSLREADSQIVRGTLLIPCRTAMRGSFPLNGTYFQVNEVFADQDSSLDPIQVPRASLWNLPRRTVYFGTSIPTIFKGLSTEGIQHCFWRGYVCLRGFDQKTRAPRPLMARLHFPASKSRARGKSSEEPL